MVYSYIISYLARFEDGNVQAGNSKIYSGCPHLLTIVNNFKESLQKDMREMNCGEIVDLSISAAKIDGESNGVISETTEEAKEHYVG